MMNDETKEILSKAMYEYVNLKAKIKELKEKADELRTNIMTIIKINDIENFDDEVNMLKYSVSKRRSFNKNEAITFITAANGNPEDFFEETEFETLKIKAKMKMEEN